MDLEKQRQGMTVVPLWLARQPAHVRDAVLERTRLVALEPGDVALPAHDPEFGLVGIVEGDFALRFAREDGSSRLIDVRGAGFWCGRATVVRPTPDSLSLVAREGGTVLHIDAVSVDGLVARHAAFRLCFADLVAVHGRIMVQLFELATNPDIAARIANKLVATVGCAEGACLRVTQEELAEMAHCSRVSVVRAIGELARAGAIRHGYRQVVVADGDALQHAAGLAPRPERSLHASRLESIAS